LLYSVRLQPELLKNRPDGKLRFPGVLQSDLRKENHLEEPGAPRRWWSQSGSNRRPPACKAGALPTELWPRPGRKKVINRPDAGADPLVVGLGGVEPPTSPLSGVRSNHLSYRPSRVGESAGNPGNSLDWQVTCVGCSRGAWKAFSKGGDPAAGSPTATLLRLHPSH
jgi:hypothetical protein